jgi:hypothetical protein
VYERVSELAGKMELKKVPDVFVIHSEGAFNAFATRFFGRNMAMVVIYSDVFELDREQGDKELVKSTCARLYYDNSRLWIKIQGDIDKVLFRRYNLFHFMQL